MRGIDLEVQAGRGLRLPRAQRGRARRRRSRSSRATASAAGARSRCSAWTRSAPAASWRERIGIVLQSGRLDPYLTVRESLGLYAGYYRAPRPVDEVIELVGLEGKADERASRLSGGQQRRLDVGMALVGDPELLFLDEPTTGFDPSARRQAWEVIAGLRDLGKTVFLTTHYMDEAQRLADRVAIIAARRDRRPRHPGGPRRPREPAGDDHLPATAGEEVTRRDHDPGRDPQRADRRALERGGTSRAWKYPAQPRGRLPGADRPPSRRGRRMSGSPWPPVPLRPEDLLAQPRLGLLHRDVPGHPPAHLRRRSSAARRSTSAAGSRRRPTTCRRSSPSR